MFRRKHWEIHNLCSSNRKRSWKRIGKDGEEVRKNISYILPFIHSTRFMASSLSNLDNNLSKKIHKNKCNYENYDKNCEECRVKYKYCDCFLEYTHFRYNLIEHKC